MSYVIAIAVPLAVSFFDRARIPPQNEKLRLRFGADFPTTWRGSLNRLSEIRKALGHSRQADVAALMGVSQARIPKLEGGDCRISSLAPCRRTSPP